ncbi:MAG: hypothetical protein WCK76_02670 [Elusimicrobiota bacterium]
MKNSKILTLICVSMLLSGCGLFKEQAAGSCLDKARAAAQKQPLSPAETDAAFEQIDKAVAYLPGSSEAVAVMEELTAAAVKSGYAKAQEMEYAALKKMISQNSGYWPAWMALVNSMAAAGDVGGLASTAIDAGRLAAAEGGDAGTKYCALLTQMAATASAAPWLKSEAAQNVDKSPDVFFEKSSVYSLVAAKVAELKAETDKLAAADLSLKQAAPAELAAAAETAALSALKDTGEIERAADFTVRVETNPRFKVAVEMVVRGNAALLAKEYSKARTMYQAALSQYPDLIDARRQLAETDYQEGESLAAEERTKKAADKLLDRAYSGVNSVIKDSAASPNRIPFMGRDNFLGETYALKAAAISSMRAVEGEKINKTSLARLETEFKSALDESIKLSPQGRLARQLFDTYTQKGF